MPTSSSSPRSAGPSDASAGTTNVRTGNELEELQKLLIGRERAELLRLRQRVEELGTTPERLSEILPDAVMLRSRRDQQLGKALTPTVEEALRQSVTRNPKPLADAIFPVIGPAIRKAVAQMFNGMVQALNTAVEHSLSLRGLKWRWEAARTGVPFAQIVMRHTLVYRVEQLFLIHRETGLLLQGVAVAGTEGQDPDMVSGMLSAIQDFIADSFKVNEGAGLHRVGELTVQVEHGPRATLAAVVRGTPPAHLGSVLQDALETIHLEFADELAAFNGDAQGFVATKGTLERCLRSQLREGKARQGLSPALKVAVAAIVLALGLWLFFHLRDTRRWRRAVEQLRSEPGLLVVEAERRGGSYFVSGLRDPLAPDPVGIIAAAKVSPEAVRAVWEPYLSFEPSFMEQRANRLLAPPPSVTLSYADGALAAVGSASDAWVVAARQAVRMMPGVSLFDTSRLVNRDLQEVQDIADEITGLRVEFPVGSSRLTAAQDSVLSVLVVRIERLRAAAQRLGRSVALDLVGRTDGAGSAATNRLLSEQRANAVLGALVARGVTRDGLTAIGMADTEPLVTAAPSDRRRINRSVTFRVSVGPPALLPSRAP